MGDELLWLALVALLGCGDGDRSSLRPDGGRAAPPRVADTLCLSGESLRATDDATARRREALLDLAQDAGVHLWRPKTPPIPRTTSAWSRCGPTPPCARPSPSPPARARDHGRHGAPWSEGAPRVLLAETPLEIRSVDGAARSPARALHLTGSPLYVILRACLTCR